MNPLDILDAIKKHGILYVGVVVGFLWLNARLSAVEKKYEDCMNDRITEAYRMNRVSSVGNSLRWWAILPSNPVGKIKKDEV